MSCERTSKPYRPGLPRSRMCDPRLELLFEPRLVEPRRGDGGRAVRDARRDDPEPAAAAGAHVQDLARDRNLLGASERGDRHLVDGGFVAVRPVLEQVADRPQTELVELPRECRADARQHVELAVEARGPRPPAGRGPGRGLVQACEDRLSTEGCHGARRQSVVDVRTPGGRYAAAAAAARGRGGRRGTSSR